MKCRQMSKVWKKKPNAAQTKALEEMARKEFFGQVEDYNKMVVIQIMHILHFDFGFGKKRLSDFFKKMKEMQKNNMCRYEAEDEDIPSICEIQLRDVGIRLEDFFE